MAKTDALALQGHLQTPPHAPAPGNAAKRAGPGEPLVTPHSPPEQLSASARLQRATGHSYPQPS